MRNKLGRFVKGNPAPKDAFKKGHIPWNKKEKLIKHCLRCGKEFYPKPSQIKIGRGKYCSKKCGFISRRGRKVPRKRKMIKLICEVCKKEFLVWPCRKTTKHCSHKCYGISRIGKKMSAECIAKKSGKNCHLWKGGRLIDKSGYVLIYIKNHPLMTVNHHVFEHRLVMENHLRRYLKPEERVHHKGIKHPIYSIKNKQDNRIENLMLFPNDSEHKKFHHKFHPLKHDKLGRFVKI